MMRLFVEGIGLHGPGLASWAAGRPILAGETDCRAAATDPPAPLLLPPNERRRAVRTVKIALAAASEAFAAAGRDPAETASVFASSGGDGETIDKILTVLASPLREISPTQFHNSVHNAPAGYWSIATGAQAGSVSLCAYDGSFAAGLLEAGAKIVAQARAVALVAYDVAYPRPLDAIRPILGAFAVALVLAPTRTAAAFACLELALGAGVPSPLPPLAMQSPAARSLPLLAALARLAQAEVTLAYLEDLSLRIDVTPL